MTGRRRAEATPFFERLCPAMTSSTEDRCRSERNVVVHVAIATPATAASRRDTARRRTAEIVAGLIRETPALAPETTVCEPPHDCAHCEQKSTCTRASQPTQGASGPAFETWETIDSRPLPRTLKKIAAAASIHPQHRPVLGTQNKLNPRLRVKRARLQPAHTPRKRLSRRFVTTARLQPGHTPCQPKTRALAPVPPALSNLPAIASDRALPENLKPRRAPETRAG